MTDINVNALAEAINDKMDRDANNIESPKLPIFLIDVQYPTAENNYTWYRLYSDGWIEQGASPTFSSWALQTVYFPIPFANGRYAISFGGKSTRASSTDVKGMVCEEKTATYFKYYAGGTDWEQKDWIACGMAAQ